MREMKDYLTEFEDNDFVDIGGYIVFAGLISILILIVFVIHLLTNL